MFWNATISFLRYTSAWWQNRPVKSYDIFFWRTLQSKASLNETMFLSLACGNVIHATKIVPYPCIDVNRPRHYFFLSVALFILQYFWVYHAIFCSAMKKKKLEWKSSGLNIFGDRSNLHRSFDADDIFIMMSDIYWFNLSLFCVWASFKILLWNEIALRNEKLWRYEHSDRKEKQFCMRHYQMVTYPNTNHIWRSLTSKTTLLDHRSIQRFTDLGVWQGLISWRGRECKTFMTHISSSV